LGKQLAKPKNAIGAYGGHKAKRGRGSEQIKEKRL